MSLFFWNAFRGQDPSFPLLNDLQALNTCKPACFYRYYPVPNLNDFRTIPNPLSTRISEISVFDGRLLKFTNFRQDEYYRFLDSTPQWLFRDGPNFIAFCEHANSHFESIYGRLLHQAQHVSSRGWMFNGYVQIRSESDCKIWFCDREYIAKTQPTPAFHPVHRMDSRACENCCRHGTTCPPSPPPSSSEIFSELITRFREKNGRRCNWISKFPVRLNLNEYPIYALFDLSIKHSDGRISERLLWPLEKSNRWILVQSPPGFGKSTLLSILMLQWVQSFSELQNYELCIMLDLAKRTINLNEARDFVTACTQELGTSEYTFEMVEKALIDNSEKMLLLLDGYDMLPEESQQKVLNFLQTSATIRKSTVVIATRPTKNSSFQNMFGKLAFIRGFSTDYLLKFSEKLGTYTSIKSLCNFFGDERLYFLSELSPYFTLVIASTINMEKVFKHVRYKYLYPLLRCIVVRVIEPKLSASYPKEHVGALINKLGKFLFHSLIADKRYVKLDVLQKLFSDDFKFLVDCNFFLRQDRESTLWAVSSKLFAVFFATLYLREEWNNLENGDQRRRFLREVFCSNVCIGDYVQGVNCMYYVGLIPEIVLKLNNHPFLESATFEMYYDVECVEKSAAFDSINLLSRVNDSFLGRYGFTINPQNDEKFLTIFACIFDFMSVKNCNVDYSFYTNNYEKKLFLVVDVKPDEDTIALQTILRAKTDRIIDRIYIDFVYSEIEDLFDFVCALLSRYLKGFELPEEVKTMPPMHFVFNLVCLICSVIEKRSATVACGDTVCGTFKILAMFKVCWKDEFKESTVCVFDQNFICATFNKESFFSQDPSEILPRLSKETSRDFRVTINLF